MKTFFTIFLIFISIINSNSQWIQQNSGTSAGLNNVKFINRYTGWICGGGVILKTTNGGNNWLSLSLPVSKTFFEIHPVDSNVIYCVGMFETIIKSTNGGVNWTVIRDGPQNSNTYFSCYFINKNTGWISGGAEQKILKTTNGGLSFDSIVRNTSGFVQDIYFKDSLTGLFCDDAGVVRKSTNGGYNWFTINIPVGTYIYSFRNFTFVNNQTGWILTSSGKVYRTTDFGFNWDSIYTFQNDGFPLRSIFFAGNNVGYAGGSGYFFYRTTNSGYNWVQHYLPYPTNGAASIFFINDTVGWKIANAGSIYFTINGGQNTLFVNNYKQEINDFDLLQNYPNPFNNQTIISFKIKKKGKYKLEIFNIYGNEIDEIFNKNYLTGNYEITLNAINLSSGIYFYKLSCENNFSVKKCILIK